MARLAIGINGPIHELWPDHSDPHTNGGEPVYGRGRAWARGDVGMRARDGIDAEIAATSTVKGFVYSKDYDDPANRTVAWNRNLFLPEITLEEGGYHPAYVFTGPCGQNLEARAVRFGRLYVKCNLASVTVTAGMPFKLTDDQVHLSPAEAGASGAARIVARATRRQTLPATGVQLVLVEFNGDGPWVRFT